MIAKELTLNSITPLKISETGSDALYYMDEFKISFLPVLSGQKYIGLVSEADVFNMSDPDKPMSGHKATLKKIYAAEHMHVFDIIRIMSAEKVTLLPVIDDKDVYLGCITVNNLAEHLARLTAADNPGAIIILELNQNDYVLSRIAQIVESQDAKILSLFVTSEFESTKLEVTMKVNIKEVQSLLQTFNRYDYIIKATYTEDENMVDDLRDRYDSLMNYLNI